LGSNILLNIKFSVPYPLEIGAIVNLKIFNPISSNSEFSYQTN